MEHPGARPTEERMPTVDTPEFSARAPLPGDERAEQLFLYPHPLRLARDRAEAERIRLADREAYAAMCRTLGQLGGLSTYYAYGPSYFRVLALFRWGKATDEDLESARAHAKTRPCSGCRGRFLGRNLTEITEDHKSLTFFEGDELCPSCARDHGVA